MRSVLRTFTLNFVYTCLGGPGSGSSRKELSHFFLPAVNARPLLTFLKACDWSGHILGASASPKSLTKKLAMSPSSTVHGGQHDTKCVTFELLLHAAFVADEIWGFMLEPARTSYTAAVGTYSVRIHLKNTAEKHKCQRRSLIQLRA